MSVGRLWFRRTIVWCLVYLWTAAAALSISYAAGWQYDGDLGWWLVMAYSFPALTLAGPLLSLASNPDLGSIYALLALMALTVASRFTLLRPAPLANGSYPPI